MIPIKDKNINCLIEREKPAIRLYGIDRTQHRPRRKVYDISYSQLKSMEVNDIIEWGTENDNYKITAIFKDDDGLMVKINSWNTYSWKIESEHKEEIKYFQWIKNYGSD